MWRGSSFTREKSFKMCTDFWRCLIVLMWPSFLFCSCICFCLYGSFNCISIHRFSWQLSVFSLCSSGLVSALLLLSTMYISLWKSPSALIFITLCGWLGIKHQLTNQPTNHVWFAWREHHITNFILVSNHSRDLEVVFDFFFFYILCFVLIHILPRWLFWPWFWNK